MSRCLAAGVRIARGRRSIPSSQPSSALRVQVTTATVTDPSPSTGYQIHVHSLSACGGTTRDRTNTVFVTTLAAGEGPRPVARGACESCCS